MYNSVAGLNLYNLLLRNSTIILQIVKAYKHELFLNFPSFLHLLFPPSPSLSSLPCFAPVFSSSTLLLSPSSADTSFISGLDIPD